VLTRQITRFAIAGTIGFIVDAAVLYSVHLLGAGLYIGRAISFLCAVLVTWQINRRITFAAGRPPSLWAELWRYLSAMSFGGLVNFAVYAAALHLGPAAQWMPLVGVAAGSIAAMIVNFISSRSWVFHQKR
jgi:putative flippase GtrA